jgi:DNA-binding Lrp family transcriptional regulator
MSFQAMTWAVEQELPAMQKIVLLMMANRMNHDTGLCCPSHDTLAKECGMSKRALIDQIRRLEELGYVSVIRTKTDKKINIANKYILNVSSKINSAGDALGGSAPRSLGSAGDALGGSAGDAPKPVNIKPVIEPKDNKPSSTELDDSFNEFYSAYPKKAGKEPALKSWKKIKPALYETIIADVKNRAANHIGWQDKQYVPNPATYLNQKRWEDEINPIRRLQTNNVHPITQNRRPFMEGAHFAKII